MRQPDQTDSYAPSFLLFAVSAFAVLRFTKSSRNSCRPPFTTSRPPMSSANSRPHPSECFLCHPLYFQREIFCQTRSRPSRVRLSISDGLPHKNTKGPPFDRLNGWWREKKKRGKFERRGKVDWTFRIYSGVVNYLKRQSFNIVISSGKETEIKGHVVVSQSAVSNSRIVSAPALTSAAPGQGAMANNNRGFCQWFSTPRFYPSKWFVTSSKWQKTTEAWGRILLATQRVNVRTVRKIPSRQTRLRATFNFQMKVNAAVDSCE